MKKKSPSPKRVDPALGFWLSTANVAAAEISAAIGFRSVVLDIEHGAFDLATLNQFVPFLKSLGFDVIGKVVSPDRAPIQQALDFGVDAVAIPHVESVAHAREVCSFAKFPSIGRRSFAGGRVARYGAVDDAWVKQQDAGTRCLPMIEDASALRDIGAILELSTVDGVFVGPSDLSLDRGRGAYRRTEADWEDLKRIADAAREVGKPWILPAWTDEEQRFGLKHGASGLVVTNEFGAMRHGLQAAWNSSSLLRASQS